MKTRPDATVNSPILVIVLTRDGRDILRPEDKKRYAMNLRCRELTIVLVAAGWLSTGAQTTPLVANNGVPADPRLAVPSTTNQGLKREIEAATTSAALEQVLVRHPDQGQLLVPRIEALTVAEIRRDGPSER